MVCYNMEDKKVWYETITLGGAPAHLSFDPNDAFTLAVCTHDNGICLLRMANSPGYDADVIRDGVDGKVSSEICFRISGFCWEIFENFGKGWPIVRAMTRMWSDRDGVDGKVIFLIDNIYKLEAKNYQS